MATHHATGNVLVYSRFVVGKILEIVFAMSNQKNESESEPLFAQMIYLQMISKQSTVSTRFIYLVCILSHVLLFPVLPELLFRQPF
jgi:hypothetical protein